MTAAEWLERGWRLSEEIRELECAREEALAFAFRVTGGGREVCVQETADNSAERRAVGYADRAAEYAALLDERIGALIGVKCEIIRATARMTAPTLRALLVARYVNFKKWEEIAHELHYCEKQVGRLHRKALAELTEVLECPMEGVVPWG